MHYDDSSVIQEQKLEIIVYNLDYRIYAMVS